MKIELKLSPDALMAVNEILQQIYNESQPHSEAGKLVKSIAFDVADKVDSKCKSLVKKATLFDSKKKHKLTLKYHEAWGLYRALSTLDDLRANDYKRVLLQRIIATLNQQLA